MTQISQLDWIIRELENLSLAELQEIKSKVDDLIEKRSESKDTTGSVPDLGFSFRLSDLVSDVKGITDLVHEWMADESGYDEETYPQIEAGLNQGQ